MANQLDLEEQEQLDQIKHFWKQYGNLITWLLIVVLGAFASWNFYQYWQKNQSSQAAAMYDEVERTVKLAEPAKVDRVFADMKEKFSSTSYAQQAGLLVAKHYYSLGQLDPAKAALTWVAEQTSEPGFQAVARLRLASLWIESKNYDEALKPLNAEFPTSYRAMVSDRKGDLLQLQGKKAEAIAEYEKAYKLFDEKIEFRRLVEVKLNALGVDTQITSASEVKK